MLCFKDVNEQHTQISKSYVTLSRYPVPAQIFEAWGKGFGTGQETGVVGGAGGVGGVGGVGVGVEVVVLHFDWQ